MNPPSHSTVRPSALNVLRRAAPLRAGGMTRHLALIAVASTLGACAKQDLGDELDRARSWTATTRLGAERLEAGATNRAVTRQLVDRASAARAQTEQSMTRLAHTDSERAVARGVLDSLRQGILQLQGVAQ